MAGLSLKAKAVKLQVGLFLAVEVRNPDGLEVTGLDKAAFKVWNVGGIGLIKKVTISAVWEVAETFTAVREGKSFSTPGIPALKGLYIVFLDLGSGSLEPGTTFAVSAQGKKPPGAFMGPNGIALASLEGSA